VTLKTVSLPSPNHGPRAEGAAVRFLILHYTGMADAATALRRLTEEASQVSAHYTVDEDGTVYAHVAEERRAWHAGVASWDGMGDINSRSVGVEIVNPGHEFGYRPFPLVQMQAVAELCRGIIQRWGIQPRDVLGHSDIAPTRKQDPGELFDWAWLAGQGVGFLPEPGPGDYDGPQDEATLRALLTRVGYDAAAPLEAALTAFQRRYQPESLGAAANGETFARLRAAAG
jgi:N-acetylmuramoyl-L-alanine amidase